MRHFKSHSLSPIFSYSPSSSSFSFSLFLMCTHVPPLHTCSPSTTTYRKQLSLTLPGTYHLHRCDTHFGVSPWLRHRPRHHSSICGTSHRAYRTDRMAPDVTSLLHTILLPEHQTQVFAKHLFRDIIPHMFNSRDILRPRHKVESHAVQKSRVAGLARETHVQLVKVIL